MLFAHRRYLLFHFMIGMTANITRAPIWLSMVPNSAFCSGLIRWNTLLSVRIGPQNFQLDLNPACLVKLELEVLDGLGSWWRQRTSPGQQFAKQQFRSFRVAQL